MPNQYALIKPQLGGESFNTAVFRSAATHETLELYLIASHTIRNFLVEHEIYFDRAYNEPKGKVRLHDRSQRCAAVLAAGGAFEQFVSQWFPAYVLESLRVEEPDSSQGEGIGFSLLKLLGRLVNLYKFECGVNRAYQDGTPVKCIMGLQDAGTIEEGTVVLPYGFAAIMLDQRFKSWLLAQDRAFIQQSSTADVLRTFNQSPWARFVHCSPMHDDPKVPMRFELPDLESNSESVILDGFAEVIARILADPDAAVDWKRVYPAGMPVPSTPLNEDA